MRTQTVNPGAPQSAAIRRQPARNHQMDLLRIVLATLVILSHAPEIIDGNRSRELLTRLTHSPVSFGVFGVDGFFLLSGALILESWHRQPQLVDFLRKRILRIVPGYVVAVVLSVLLVGLLAPGVPDFFHHLGPKLILTTLTLNPPSTPRVFPGLLVPIANGSLWTIAYEFRCYLFVAAFGVLGFLKTPTRWLIFWAVLMVGWLFAEPIRPHVWRPLVYLLGDPREVLRLTAIYFIGGLFYLYRARIVFRPLYALVAFAALVATRFLMPMRFEMVLALAGGYLLFYFISLRLPALDFMRRVPDISYGIYLYGWPVESLWIFYHRSGSPWLAFLASTLICACLGWLSWHFVERPMLRFKGRKSVPLPPP